jgi:O-antigen ligase
MLISERFQFINMKSVTLFLLTIEIILASLFFFDKLLALAFVLSIVSLFLFYFLLLKGPFIWIIIMIYTSTLDSWGRIGGGVTVFHVSWGMTILTTVIYFLMNPSKKLKIYTSINIYFYLFIGLASFSLLYSPNYLDGLRVIGTSTALFMVFILYVNFLNTEKQYHILINNIVIANILLALLTIYQILFENVLFIGTSSVGSESGTRIWRAMGTFEDPNVTAVYLVFGIILSLSMLIFGKLKWKVKLFYFSSSLISTFAVVATFSRTGWLALVFGIFVLLFYIKNKKYIFFALAGISIIVIIFLFVSPYGEFIRYRLFSFAEFLGDESIRSRFSMAISSIRMFIDYPITGIGFRAYPVYYDLYIDSLAPQSLLYVKESHTMWLTYLAEMSIWGVMVVLLWFIRVFIDNNKLINISGIDFFRAILIGSYAIFFVFNVALLFYGFLFPHFNLLWLVFGIIYSINRRLVNQKAI